MARQDTTNTELFDGSEESNDNPQHITKYPKNWVTVTSAGHVMEFDNTEDGERIRLIIDKYFNILTIVFFILLVGSVFIIRFL